MDSQLNPDQITKIAQRILPPRSRKLRINDKKRIGRNSPCFCGSGVKFKRCCIKKVERLENEPKRCL